VAGRAGPARTGWASYVGPDLLVTDLGMPQVDGLQLLRASRDAEPAHDPLVLVYSSTDQARRRAAGEYAGANAWLDKPADPATLLSAIELAQRPLTHPAAHPQRVPREPWRWTGLSVARVLRAGPAFVTAGDAELRDVAGKLDDAIREPLPTERSLPSLVGPCSSPKQDGAPASLRHPFTPGLPAQRRPGGLGG
jgi:DNA-binding response OmpR family regulator